VILIFKNFLDSLILYGIACGGDLTSHKGYSWFPVYRALLKAYIFLVLEVIIYKNGVRMVNIMA
jgi:hypothetical protein